MHDAKWCKNMCVCVYTHGHRELVLLTKQESQTPHSTHPKHAQHALLARQSLPALSAPFVVPTLSVAFVVIEESTVGWVTLVKE